MAFVKYQTTNNANSYLTTAISSTTTTFIVNDGDIFPSVFPYLLTLEHYDNDGNVTKREIVKCTARSGNNLTVVRGFEYCIADDTSNPKTLQNAPYSFMAGDMVGLTITSGLIKDIQDEIGRQEIELQTSEDNIDDIVSRISDIETFINNF